FALHGNILDLAIGIIIGIAFTSHTLWAYKLKFQTNMAGVGRCCGNFCKEFKQFALRGNVIDLAIGIIIGTAFTAVVQSFVDDIITPPFGLILGGVDFVNLTAKMKNFVYKDQPPVVIRYGKFIQTLISLFIMAFALFFLITSVNKLHQLSLRKKQTEETIQLETSDEVKILCEIRDLLAKQSASEK
ncbi:unnamed protein product, partial [Rotaria magnacalcarata]